MRNIQDGEAGDALWVEQSNAPGHSGAPIVAGEEDTIPAELVGNGDDVGDEFRQSIGNDASGFAALVVAALVGHDDAEARRGKRLEDVSGRELGDMFREIEDS